MMPDRHTAKGAGSCHTGWSCAVLVGMANFDANEPRRGKHPKRVARLAALALSSLLAASSAFAIERGKNGYYHTGDGIRVKSIAFLKLKIYVIGHDMRELPAAKTKRAVIDADVDKRIAWRMLRDAGGDRLQGILRDSFAKNNYADASKIGAFLAAFRGGLKENDTVVITYAAASKSTLVQVQGAPPVTLPGIEFMKATWSIWFGNSDDPELGNALISKL
jgi:hypothetical protein